MRAQLSLTRNDASNAIEALKAAAPYELSVTELSVGGSCYPVYIRGQAYLSAYQGREAAVEFQKILDHFQIGRAYAMSGKTAKARSAYRDFSPFGKTPTLTFLS